MVAMRLELYTRQSACGIEEAGNRSSFELMYGEYENVMYEE